MEVSKSLRQSTLFAEASLDPARTSRAQVTKLEFPASEVVYGRNITGSFARFDPDSSSWRTSQLCLIEGRQRFAETWPRSGTTQSGTAYPLPCWERPTTATGSGLLPTPTTKANQLAPSMMKHAGCRRLKEMMLPTPNAGSDHWGGSWRECGGSGNALRGTVLGEQKIHPLEWEWIMGYPAGWTALDPSETPSSRKSRKSLAGQL